MVQGIRFKITFLNEASVFLKTLAEAPREKIYYNIRKVASGQSITLASMMRGFKALGVQVALDMKGIGRVAL